MPGATRRASSLKAFPRLNMSFVPLLSSQEDSAFWAPIYRNPFAGRSLSTQLPLYGGARVHLKLPRGGSSSARRRFPHLERTALQSREGDPHASEPLGRGSILRRRLLGRRSTWDGNDPQSRNHSIQWKVEASEASHSIIRILLLLLYSRYRS